MSPQEVATLIISRWRLEHTVEGIMMALLMQRAPMSREEIMMVIRRYCDSCSENATYRAQRRLGEA